MILKIKLLIFKIKLWTTRQLWWRFYYRKVKLTDKEAWNEKCLHCHASIHVNRHDNVPVCEYRTHPCPCKWNECLKCL